MLKIDNILIVGNPETFHVGAHFYKAAQNIGLKAEIIDVRDAFGNSRFFQSALWKFGGKKPQKLNYFGRKVVACCKERGYSLLLATGMAPLDQKSLCALRHAGVQTINYLTDDPWNQAHRSAWFLKAIKLYNNVFTTRRSNIFDLKKTGCTNINYCPFGYDNNKHKNLLGTMSDFCGADIMFVGGADSDRIKIMDHFVSNNFSLALFGGYWNKTKGFAKYSCGSADLLTLARYGQVAKIVICLVRRANRDGHVMRSYEAAASAACMLVEDTMEHREIFGEDGECVVFFNSNEQMILRARWLLDHPEERLRLRHAVYRRIVLEGKNTYTNRLRTILKTVGVKV